MNPQNEILCKLALYLYNDEERESDPYDNFNREDLKRLSGEVLKDISGIVYKKLTNFQEAENLFTLILEYGEFRSKEYFMAGFDAGMKVSKEIDRL